MMRGKVGGVHKLLEQTLKEKRENFKLVSGSGNSRSKISVFYDEEGKPHSFLYSDFKTIYRFLVPEDVRIFRS